MENRDNGFRNLERRADKGTRHSPLKIRAGINRKVDCLRY